MAIGLAIVRDLEAHGRTGSGARADLQPAAELPGPLLHRGQAEMARAQTGTVGIEPDAVVGDLDRAGAELDGDVLGPRVSQRVVKGLEHDSQHGEVALRVARGRVTDE